METPAYKFGYQHPLYHTRDGIGFVQVVETMGNDARICKAARVDKQIEVPEGHIEIESLSSDDEKLIRYLMRHKHTSPFELSLIHI